MANERAGAQLGQASGAHGDETLSSRLAQVKNRIEVAAIKAGRRASDIKLIAVSKTKPIEMILQARDCGQSSFGENYVQEALQKAFAHPELDWHLIGSLQTNKVKGIGSHFSLIHSVDRMKLALELDKTALERGGHQDILLQIHLGNEETKQGFLPEELCKMLQELQSRRGLRLRGLMSLPPLTSDEKLGRGYFASLRKLLEVSRRELSGENAGRFQELSMGTTHDFEWAVQEGATMVRIGTAIFGDRQ